MTAYLGPDRATWRAHDACALIEDGAGASFDEILIDQDIADRARLSVERMIAIGTPSPTAE